MDSFAPASWLLGLDVCLHWSIWNVLPDKAIKYTTGSQDTLNGKSRVLVRIQKAINSNCTFSINSDTEDWHTRKKQTLLWSQAQKCGLRRKTNELVSFAVSVQPVISTQQDSSSITSNKNQASCDLLGT